MSANVSLERSLLNRFIEGRSPQSAAQLSDQRRRVQEPRSGALNQTNRQLESPAVWESVRPFMPMTKSAFRGLSSRPRVEWRCPELTARASLYFVTSGSRGGI